MREPEPCPPPLGATLPLDDVGALMEALSHTSHPGPEAPPGAGRVLRVQLGYNPNSSSLGTSVVMLLWGVAGTTVVLQAVLATLLARAAGPRPPGGAS